MNALALEVCWLFPCTAVSGLIRSTRLGFFQGSDLFLHPPFFFVPDEESCALRGGRTHAGLEAILLRFKETDTLSTSGHP